MPTEWANVFCGTSPGLSTRIISPNGSSLFFLDENSMTLVLGLLLLFTVSVSSISDFNFLLLSFDIGFSAIVDIWAIHPM